MASLTPRNRLANEKSPYLLQHAGNPVDWYPWGEEAFAKAHREDSPVFLSIGYSTCHWCHVMEKESFEDEAVARLMNESFVAIKVDREERPDIDNIYMTACQMMTGSGGWPLSIIMTPDKRPFFAGTYIPKDNHYGRLGMIDLIPRIVDVWKNRRQDALNSAEQITAALRQDRTASTGQIPGISLIESAAQSLHERFDSVHGGFGRAPKFPTPHNLTLLLRHWKRTGDAGSLAIVEQTLTAMREGGIYDHIGFGFHRYSTDAKWLVPHFEKMLYDQALLVIANTEAYQATGKAEYARTASEVIEYVLRDMTSQEGAFWSAEDADSEGEEGKFYLWSLDEVRAALAPDEAELFIHTFNLTPEGNFVEQGTQERTGTNIPHLSEPPRNGVIETIRQRLFAAREMRVHPSKDDKVLTDWNGLMIAAMCQAAQALDRPEFAHAARRAADFILQRLRRADGRLLHRYRDGEASLPAHLDDYSFMTWGLLELYETTFDVRHLHEAIALNQQMIDHFWDEKSGGLFFTADDGEELLVRTKETYDGAIPSGNSIAMLNLVRLARMTGRTEFEEKTEAMARSFAGDLQRMPSAYSQMLQAVDFLIGPANEIVVCGRADSADTQSMLRAIHSAYLPRKIVLFRPSDQESPPITKIAEFTSAHSMVAGRTTAYVCRDFACQQPTNDPAVMIEQLQE